MIESDETVNVESEIEAPAAEEPGVAASQYETEASDMAAALAILKAAKMADPDAPTMVAPPVATTEAAPVVPAAPAVEPPKADDAAKLLERMTAMEAQLRAAQAEKKDMSSRLERLAAYEAAVAKSSKGDIEELARLGGWTPEMILKAVEKGPEAVQPTLIEKRIEEMAAENAKFRQQLENEKAQRTLDEYKGTLSRNVSSFEPNAPLLVQYYTDPDTGVVDAAAVAEEIFAFQIAARNHVDSPRDVSAAEAAVALNAALDNQRKRLMGKQPKPAPTAAPVSPVATPAPSQSPSVIRKPRVAPTPAASQFEREAEDEAEALALLRAALKGNNASAAQ